MLTTSYLPKIFMQTWKTNEIPDHWKPSKASVIEKMGHWQYHLMTDAMNREFVQEHFPDFLPIYDSFPYSIQRADAIRYMWLYINGGIYMDLDIVLNRPLDDLLIGDCEVYLVPSGNIKSCYTNALMASKPRSRFWLECLEEIRKSVENPSPLWFGRHLYVMNTTGPMMLTRVAKRTNVIIGILPSRLLTPCSLCELPCRYSSDVYAYAIEGSSWVTWDTLVYNFFFCHWRTIVALIFFFLLLVVLGWLLG